jgi:hypothetical protein
LKASHRTGSSWQVGFGGEKDVANLMLAGKLDDFEHSTPFIREKPNMYFELQQRIPKDKNSKVGY